MHNPTSRQHFEKYEALRTKLGIRFDQDSYRLFRLNSLDELRRKFNEDPILNNIPLSIFDAYAASAQIYTRHPYQYELVCIAKHCLIYDTLGATPVFTD